MTAHTANTPRLNVSSALATAQPWVRDHYAALRAEAGPRLHHAKAVVVPVLADTTTKVREDYLPAAAHASSHLAATAAKRSAPYRAELASRGVTTLAAVRGQISAEDVADLQRRGRGRKAKIVGAAALLGAATGAGIMLWQRSHCKSWDQDELVHEVLDEPSAEDDPANPDGGPGAVRAAGAAAAAEARSKVGSAPAASPGSNASSNSSSSGR